MRTKMFYTEIFLKLVIYVSKQTNNLLVCIRNITLMQIPKMGYNINPHALKQGNSLIQKEYQSLKKHFFFSNFVKQNPIYNVDITVICHSERTMKSEKKTY